MLIFMFKKFSYQTKDLHFDQLVPGYLRNAEVVNRPTIAMDFFSVQKWAFWDSNMRFSDIRKTF